MGLGDDTVQERKPSGDNDLPTENNVQKNVREVERKIQKNSFGKHDRKGNQNIVILQRKSFMTIGTEREREEKQTDPFDVEMN